ncbi:MAG TPA: hypothetical protein VGO67_14710 [Verrucomicrobiae bacterium]|jgi:hypothetical protein
MKYVQFHSGEAGAPLWIAVSDEPTVIAIYPDITQPGMTALCTADGKVYSVKETPEDAQKLLTS